jgi:hypothetical protein
MTVLLLLSILIAILVTTKPGYDSIKATLFRRARHDTLSSQRIAKSMVQREVYDCFLFSVGKWETDDQWGVYVGVLTQLVIDL